MRWKILTKRHASLILAGVVALLVSVPAVPAHAEWFQKGQHCQKWYGGSPQRELRICARLYIEFIGTTAGRAQTKFVMSTAPHADTGLWAAGAHLNYSSTTYAYCAYGCGEYWHYSTPVLYSGIDTTLFDTINYWAQWSWHVYWTTGPSSQRVINVYPNQNDFERCSSSGCVPTTPW